MFKARVALAATLSGNYGIYNGFELLEHEPIPGKEEYLEFGEIRAQDARLEQARQHQGVYRPPQPAPQRQSGAVADQQPAICAGRRQRRHRLRQGDQRRRQRRRGGDRAYRGRSARILVPFWRHRDRSARTRARRVSAIENLITGERTSDRMGRRAPAHRPGAGSRPAVAVFRMRCRAVNVMPRHQGRHERRSRRAVVQGRDHLPAACQGVRRQQ